MREAATTLEMGDCINTPSLSAPGTDWALWVAADTAGTGAVPTCSEAGLERTARGTARHRRRCKQRTTKNANAAAPAKAITAATETPEIKPILGAGPPIASFATTTDAAEGDGVSVDDIENDRAAEAEPVGVGVAVGVPRLLPVTVELSVPVAVGVQDSEPLDVPVSVALPVPLPVTRELGVADALDVADWLLVPDAVAESHVTPLALGMSRSK